jgi:hypothetical protein
MIRTIIKVLVVSVALVCILAAALYVASEHENSQRCKRAGADHYAHGSCYFKMSDEAHV